MITLYKWQEECLEKWKENFHRGVIEVTTGGGKTILASSGAKRLYDEKEGKLSIYVVVPCIPLLTQWRDTLRLAGLEGAVIQNREKLITSDISIFTINRARDRVPLLIESDMKNGSPFFLSSTSSTTTEAEQTTISSTSVIPRTLKRSFTPPWGSVPRQRCRR